MPKSPFNAKELAEFRDLLLEKKTRIVKEIQLQVAEASQEKVEHTGDIADMATELLDRELNLSLSENEREILNEIDDALERIKSKQYGICVDTGELIAKARLKAIPEAKRTIAAQEKFDKLQRDKKKKLGAGSFKI
ncbi:MAG: TraR/DksA family transcriptional regulator [Leptospiraceae bacterium]|nr:TraR/DksA family transcriptional regulator [Leptospiraceae bacterium]MCB1200648.1 TraR/DksA family transcriptional regulator [Leptospiraceae bacterium]